jgi:hypothetical protein
MKLKDKNIDLSIEEAMKTLDGLKAIQIDVKSEKEIQVQRKLTKIDAETRTLIEVFNMGDYNKLPYVEM